MNVKRSDTNLLDKALAVLNRVTAANAMGEQTVRFRDGSGIIISHHLLYAIGAPARGNKFAQVSRHAPSSAIRRER
jgi:hypothetical protein